MASIAGTAADAEELRASLRVELVHIGVDCAVVTPWRPKVREFPERVRRSSEQHEVEQQLVAEGSALEQSGCTRMDLHLRWHVAHSNVVALVFAAILVQKSRQSALYWLPLQVKSGGTKKERVSSSQLLASSSLPPPWLLASVAIAIGADQPCNLAIQSRNHFAVVEMEFRDDFTIISPANAFFLLWPAASMACTHST
jgi:hypothetical protein